MSSTVQTDKERMQSQRAAKKAKSREKNAGLQTKRDQLKMEHAQGDTEEHENDQQSITFTNIYMLIYSFWSITYLLTPLTHLHCQH